MLKEVKKKLPKGLAEQFEKCVMVNTAIRTQMYINAEHEKKAWDEIRKLGLMPENCFNGKVDNKGRLIYEIISGKGEKK